MLQSGLLYILVIAISGRKEGATNLRNSLRNVQLVVLRRIGPKITAKTSLEFYAYGFGGVFNLVRFQRNS